MIGQSNPRISRPMCVPLSTVRLHASSGATWGPDTRMSPSWELVLPRRQETFSKKTLVGGWPQPIPERTTCAYDMS